MERIDKTSEEVSQIVKDSNPAPDAVILGIIIDKINEIVDWINTQ
ncbi:MAG: hypothetical protein GOVbin212_8 [Prokaryotic dsDNA virus sp.]|nr:MAG: hypothetical protein GOVbin212_8 [Prokaryotic dsDNA virus sp.]|tara:strand:+ start:2796 stop:2930 length:135 start_codon:yes stop_codon:yes gene_type:complete